VTLRDGRGHRRRRVLVIDDDANLCDILERALVERGYDVESAANGLEGLSVLPGWRPDLIVLDLMMPVMDAWHFRAEQRRTEFADVPVLLLTSHWHAASAASSLDALAAIRKPFELDSLLETVERLVS
jgi:DNA-binding response OmpR family regulator